MHEHPFTRSRIVIVVLLALLGSLILYSSAQYYISVAAEKRATALHDDLISNHRVSDLDALVDKLAYYQFGGLPVVPGTEPWDHHAGPFPVDWENFPAEMTTNLIAYLEGDVPVYDLYVLRLPLCRSREQEPAASTQRQPIDRFSARWCTYEKFRR